MYDTILWFVVTIEMGPEWKATNFMDLPSFSIVRLVLFCSCELTSALFSKTLVLKKYNAIFGAIGFPTIEIFLDLSFSQIFALRKGGCEKWSYLQLLFTGTSFVPSSSFRLKVFHLDAKLLLPPLFRSFPFMAWAKTRFCCFNTRIGKLICGRGNNLVSDSRRFRALTIIFYNVTRCCKRYLELMILRWNVFMFMRWVASFWNTRREWICVCFSHVQLRFVRTKLESTFTEGYISSWYSAKFCCWSYFMYASSMECVNFM